MDYYETENYQKLITFIQNSKMNEDKKSLFFTYISQLRSFGTLSVLNYIPIE